jgi:hypothetical protein
MDVTPQKQEGKKKEVQQAAECVGAIKGCATPLFV